MRVQLRLKPPHGLVQRSNPRAQVRYFGPKLRRFRHNVGLYLLDLTAVSPL